VHFMTVPDGARKTTPHIIPAHRRPWRAKFRSVRAALRKAEKLSGAAREKALIAVCEMVVAAEHDPPVPWMVKEDGSATRVFDATTAVYDEAERELEGEVSDACGQCLGCYMTGRHDHSKKRALTSRRSR
jgi:hypothetical protein